MRVEPAVPPERLAAIRAPLEAAGAQSVDAPLLQPLNLLLDLAGEAMRARLFVVQSEGGTESCLRPDFTVAIAQQHVESTHVGGSYFYEGSAFRAAAGAMTIWWRGSRDSRPRRRGSRSASPGWRRR